MRRSATVVDVTTRVITIDRPYYEEVRYKGIPVASELTPDNISQFMPEVERRIYEGVLFQTSDGREQWLYFDIADVMTRLPWIQGIISVKVDMATRSAMQEVWEAREESRVLKNLDASWRRSLLYRVYKFFNKEE